MTTTTTTRKQTEITATAIFKIVGQPCWGVPSDDKGRTLPYKVCYEKETSNWTCDCRHGQVCQDRGISANCKHVRACETSVLANKAEQARKRAEDTRQMDELAAEMRADSERRSSAPLNGSREFSLLR